MHTGYTLESRILGKYSWADAPGMVLAGMIGVGNVSGLSAGLNRFMMDIEMI